MATYMELCNLVLKQLNEVEFLQTTFGSPTGFHAQVKDAVNFSLSDIAQSEIEWPFSLVHITKTCTAEVNFIAFENDLQRVDWQSFHLERDDALAGGAVLAKHLDALTYDEWQFHRRAYDEQNNTGMRLPLAVFQKPEEEFGITPIPDRAYQFTYAYYTFLTELSAFDDVTVVPDRFKRVIFHGAMHYAYMFRDNLDQARVSSDMFENGIKHMRTLLINKYLRVQDTRVNQQGSGRFSRIIDG